MIGNDQSQEDLGSILPIILSGSSTPPSGGGWDWPLILISGLLFGCIVFIMFYRDDAASAPDLPEEVRKRILSDYRQMNLDASFRRVNALHGDDSALTELLYNQASRDLQRSQEILDVLTDI